MTSSITPLIAACSAIFLSTATLVQADYQAEVLADAPLVFYRCNEISGTVTENLGSLGAAAQGTYAESGVALDQPSAAEDLGSAVGFSGGFITVPDLMLGPLSTVTVEAWVKRTSDPVDFFAIFAGDGFETGDLHLNLVGAQAQLQFAVADNPTPFPQFVPSWPVTDWNYIVVTYDTTSGQVQFYLNGHLFGTAMAGTTPIAFTGGTIGAWLNTFVSPPAPQRFLDGCLDEIAIYESVLSPERVRAHYNAVATGVAIATHPHDVVTLEGRPATFGVEVTGANPQYQWFKNGEAIPGANRGTYSTPPTSLADDGAIFFVLVSNAVSSATSSDAILTVVERPTTGYAETILADAPLVYYRLDESDGTTVANSGSLGSAADGTLAESGAQLGASSASANLATAIGLDGVGGFVRMPDLGLGGLTQCSVELWLKWRGVPNPFYAVYAGDGFESGDLHINLVEAGPLLEFAVADNASPYPRFQPLWGEEEWHHLVLTYETDSGQALIYFDGGMIGQANAGTTPIHFDGGQIGAWLNTFVSPAAPQRFLNGAVDEFAVYDTVLTPAQVLRHYAASAPPPPPYAAAVLSDSPLVYYRLEETNGLRAENLGSLGPAADGTYAETGVALGQSSAFSGLGRSMALDGSAGFLRVPDLGLGPLAEASVEMWVKPRSNPGSLQAVLAGDGFETGDLHLNLVGAGPSVECAVSGNSTFPQFSPAWAVGEWHHLVLTYSGGAESKARLYLDTVLVDEASTEGTLIEFTGSQIGAWLNTFVGPPESQRFLDALIDEIAIYPTVLAPERILAHYGAINTRPAITGQPADATVLECYPVTFQVNATGPNLRYQWFKNDLPISGAEDASYTTTTTQQDDGAVFSVMVSNVVAATMSRNALLRVVARPSGSYAATVLGDAPFVYYHFDETSGTTAANAGSLGSAADGMVSESGAAWGYGAPFPGLGSALDLDGASGFVRVPDLAQPPMAQATIELWVMPRGTPAPFYALYAGDGFEAGDLHVNLTEAEPKVEFAVSGNATFPRFVPAWSNGGWHQLAATYDASGASSTITLYFDGQLVGQATSGTTLLSFTGGQIGAWLNTFVNPAASERFLNGAIDEFALYDTALLPEQILSHYASVAAGRLSFRLVDDQLQLEWSGCGLILQENVDVADPGGWANVPNGDLSPVTVPLDATQKYYRLAKP
jgi:Concanavalin A-like lectin/glucanases superfamily